MSNAACRASVVIPLYNSASTLPRAVKSVLRQTLEDCEILIVDDGSQDDSLAQAHAFARTSERIEVIALAENGGKSHAMNVALPRARGAWIAVLDADDWYEPNRLATLLAAGEAHGVDLVADNQRFWDAGAGALVRIAFPATSGGMVLTSQAFSAGSNPYAEFDYGMLKPVVRADFIRRSGLRYRENARLSEDFLFLLDFFLRGGTFYLSNEPLYNWTQPFGSISRNWTSTGAGNWRYQYRSALAAHADALRSLAPGHDPALARLVARRIRAFGRLHHLNTINRMRRSGVPQSRLLIEAARHPGIWPELVIRMLRTLRHHGDAIRPAMQGRWPLRRR